MIVITHIEDVQSLLQVVAVMNRNNRTNVRREGKVRNVLNVYVELG